MLISKLCILRLKQHLHYVALNILDWTVRALIGGTGASWQSDSASSNANFPSPFAADQPSHMRYMPSISLDKDTSYCVRKKKREKDGDKRESGEGK